MKNLVDICIVSAHWDSGQPDTYRAIIWDFTAMQPVEEFLDQPIHRTDIDLKSIAYKCYKIYLHNYYQTNLRNNAIYDTDSPHNTRRGDIVKVHSGRKCPIGVVGEIVDLMDYGYGTILTIRDERHEYKVYAKNCEVLAVDLSRKPRELALFQSYPEITELEREILK